MRSLSGAVVVAVLAIVATGAPAATLNVGPGQTYSTVQAAVNAAVAGDTIQVWSNTYVQSAGWATINKANLTIVGVGTTRPVLDANGSCLSGKGIFVVSSTGLTVQNLEFKNTRNTSDLNGAGIRQQAANLTVRDCYFHDNDDGILADGISGSTILIETSEFNHNGYGDGQSHNMYIGAIDTFTLRYCWSHNAYVGHEVKDRAKVSYILYNRLGNEGGNGSYECSACQGGTTYIIGNQIEQSSTTGNSTIIDYASEGEVNPDSHLYVVNNTVVNNRSSGIFVNNHATSTAALVQNNIFQGSGTIVSGLNTQVTNWATANAYLANPSGYDYHLTASSTGAINAGVTPGVGVNGFDMNPTLQYVHPCSNQSRPVSGTIDIGAYEYATGDTTAPAAVTNLATSSPTSSSLTLSWTAPGDDGNSGTATTYDIRYSTSTINDSNWASATQVSGEPTPAVAGTNQNMTVSGLSASTTYYFAIKTADEVPNWSGLSNIASGTTTTPPDTTAPAAVTNLATSSPTSSSLTLSWTAPGDDGNSGTATTYDIRYSTSTINDSNWASATQVSGEPTPAVAGTNQNMTVSGLSASTTYYFAIKTADEVPNWSSLSNIASGTTSGATQLTGKVEAEAGVLANGAQVYSDAGASGGQAVGWLDGAGHSDSFGPCAAATSIDVYYCSPNTGKIGLYINSTRYDLNFTSTGSWAAPYSKLTLNQAVPTGATVKVQYDTGDSAINIDYIYLNTGTPVGDGTGLVGDYYNNMDLTGFVLRRTDATVNFDWGSGSPDPSIGVDTFSVRWTGQVQPLYSETYTFYTTSDDGVRLWVNNQLVVDSWINQSPTEHSGTISLTAGTKYDIKMEYYENGGGAVAKLSWSSASTPKAIIPQSQLYPPVAVNLALNMAVTVSSTQGSSYLGAYAVDGLTTTRWSSTFSDPQWIYVDLGSTSVVTRVKLRWEAAYGKNYTIDVSSDATNWTTVYTVTNGDGGIDDWTVTPVAARYVRMYGTARGTGYGYSLWEFEIY